MKSKAGVALTASILLAGCLGGGQEPGAATALQAPDPGCTADEAACSLSEGIHYVLTMSKCTSLPHTMDAPAAVYQPDYPPGTTATSSAETIALLEVLLCEQATDHNSTVAPFHLAIFGTSIRNPGPSGQQATATLLGHDLVTNAPNLLAEAARAGYRTFSTKSFNLARPGATDGQKATPYMLRVGGEPPLYEFKGTMNRQAVASSPTHSKWMYYSTGDDGLEALQLSMALHAAGPSQAAAGSFGPDSYWSTKKGPSAWEAINFPHEKGSGTLEIQPLLTF